MTTHVAILLRRYIRLVLAGSKTVESRLTRTRKAPLDCVSVGDTIHFKASAGPYMATAVVAKVETHRDLTPAKVEALRRKHHKAVGGDAAYWRAKREARYATFITLRDVKATSAGPVRMDSLSCPSLGRTSVHRKNMRRKTSCATRTSNPSTSPSPAPPSPRASCASRARRTISPPTPSATPAAPANRSNSSSPTAKSSAPT
ncbi:MAG: ASCH domain-containing protein [Planctomycetota bacterium]|nr:ASCH domain-containing protein [Planctomycetota bacterium]